MTKFYRNKEIATADKDLKVIIRAIPQDSISGNMKKPDKQYYIVEIRDYHQVKGGRSYTTSLHTMTKQELRDYLNIDGHFRIV